MFLANVFGAILQSGWQLSTLDPGGIADAASTQAPRVGSTFR
jgi:hypothetical protein